MAQSLPSPDHTERPGNTKDRKREYIIIIVRGWKINQTIANLSLSLTHIQCLSRLCPHQSGVSLGLSLLRRQEVHLGLVTLQKLPADVAAATRVTQTLKQHSHHISYHINSIQVLEQCTYVSPLRSAWKTLSTSSGCMDQIAPPPLLGDRCILGDLPPAPALERMELRTEDDLKSGTSTKTEWDSFLLISSKNKERDDDDDAQGSPSSLLKETVDCWEETGSERRKKSEILWSILWVFVSTHTQLYSVFLPTEAPLWFSQRLL